VITSTNNISYGYWRPIYTYNISVEKASLTFTYPAGIKIYRKEVGILAKSTGTDKKNMIVLNWEVSNLKAIEDEPFDVSISERTPGVYLMPSELVYDNSKGEVNNWEEYGKWVYNLFKGRDELPDAEKLKVMSLLKDIPDTLARIKTLYKYMQNNTRYVAVKLGIGGYQPFDAKTVNETGYGECKALSNYMHSLLKVIGVKSYPTLVSSGRYIEPIFAGFPNFSQFDHVILCVPLKDTIWLECTNQKMPFGFLGDFTDDRDVLLLTEDGGKFAHTKKYTAENNFRTCTSHFVIDSTGKAECTSVTRFSGLQYDEIFGFLQMNYEEQKKWLYRNSKLPSPQITGFSVTSKTEELPLASINESLISKNYGSFTGQYLIIPLNLINVQNTVQRMLKPRYSEILISRSSIDYDTLIYQIPKNYRLESVPEGKSLNTIFGNYSSTVSVKENQITYIRKFLINQGRFKPSEYKDFYDFILAISKADNIKLIMTKKT
jgi:hypothetical protein